MDDADNDEKWVREQVTQVLGEEAAKEWLRHKNGHLDGRTPLEMLRSGEGKRVRSYVTALLDGSFL